MNNRQYKLAARPVGMVKRSDFEFSSSPAPEPGPGQVLVRVMYVSLDPAMRGWMNEGRSYIAPVGLGEVMRAGTAGRVVASNNPGFAVGDYVAGWAGCRITCSRTARTSTRSIRVSRPCRYSSARSACRA